MGEPAPCRVGGPREGLGGPEGGPCGGPPNGVLGGPCGATSAASTGISSDSLSLGFVSSAMLAPI